MKKSWRFITKYKLFSLAVTGLLAGLVLLATHQSTALHWTLGTVAIFEVLPLLWGMLQDVRAGTYGIDILAATAIVTSVLLGQYWAGLVVVIMLTGGEALEDYAHRRAQTELDELLKRAPQTAHLIVKGKTSDVPVSQLKAGDKIIIKAGEVVPVDAVVTEGSASFDEASLTGESLPQAKDIKDTLLSGSINLDGAVTAKATASAADSQYQQIIKLVRSAAHTQAPFVRLADRYSLPFTFAAFAIAGSVWAISGHAIRFLEVIVVATPCPLILAAPIALISGMARASRYGIIVKTGASLERLAEARTIAFDKTGTLTSGQPTVASVKTYNKATEQEVISLAASLEQSSNHVLAHALTSYAQAENIRLIKVKHVKEIAGRGLQTSVRGQAILVGRYSLLSEHGVKMPAGFSETAIKQTAVFVASNDQLIGVISFQDTLRPETADTLQTLERLGLDQTLMLTGDNLQAANAIAKQLHINQVDAEMLPADKLHRLDAVKDRPLIYVGDGVNDAPALTAADVGIAIGARGSTAASESADLVILQNDLSLVATAYQLARYTFRIARQSILAGIMLSLVLMIIFSTGKFSPLLGALLQEVVDVVVIFNALRAHLFKSEITGDYVSSRKQIAT